MAQVPELRASSEFEPPVIQPLANLAWEDGVYITRDGLNLYAFFTPMDIFKAVANSATPDLFFNYQRGALIGQDFSNPLGQSTPWLHADVAMATRETLDDRFCNWKLSNLKGQYYNLWAPAGIWNSNAFDLFVYTDDSGGTGTKIKLLRNIDRNLLSSGTLLPANVNETSYHQDNPHIERIDSGNPNRLVLFFESDNKPGSGSNDIWFSTSEDNGVTWTNPLNATALNTSGSDLQPHLYFDGAIWWIYYASNNSADGKLAIWRARQGQAGNWNSWQNKEIVISSGTSFGVGEPTLTSRGDISFVVVTKNISGGTNFDQYDVDPWFLKKK